MSKGIFTFFILFFCFSETSSARKDWTLITSLVRVVYKTELIAPDHTVSYKLDTIEGTLSFGADNIEGAWTNGFCFQKGRWTGKGTEIEYFYNSVFLNINSMYFERNLEGPVTYWFVCKSSYEDTTGVGCGCLGACNHDGGGADIKFLQWIDNSSVHDPQYTIVTNEKGKNVLTAVTSYEQKYLMLDSMTIYQAMKIGENESDTNIATPPIKKGEKIMIAMSDMMRFEIISKPSAKWINLLDNYSKLEDEPNDIYVEGSNDGVISAAYLYHYYQNKEDYTELLNAINVKRDNFYLPLRGAPAPDKKNK